MGTSCVLHCKVFGRIVSQIGSAPFIFHIFFLCTLGFQECAQQINLLACECGGIVCLIPEKLRTGVQATPVSGTKKRGF